MNDLGERRRAKLKKLWIAGAGVAAFALLASVAARVAPAGTVLADAPAPAGCANTKLPRAFVSDPRIVRALGGTAGGAASGDGTIGVTTVVRPDAGTLNLAVAQNERDRELGLMCVTKMAPRSGMIFVFGNETVENFWMKDTLIPLDMIFASGDGRVNVVAANVPSSRMDQADTTVARRSGLGRYVIELNAGEAARDGIKPGVVLQIPPLLSMD